MNMPEHKDPIPWMGRIEHVEISMTLMVLDLCITSLHL